MSATVAVALKKVAIYILGDEKKRGKLFVLIGSIAVGFIGLMCLPVAVLSSMGSMEIGNNFVGWGLNVFDFDNTDWYGFVFNLVFCATAATIVSGAMAERTKFISYCIYSFVISLFVYPIEAHWVWGGQAWLTNMGFVDFAGSCVIHMVGGFTGLIGAAMLGPRIGKYDKNGKSVPILGHNIVVAALGVFILWFGWYGFNGAAAADGDALGKIFATTTIAPAFATCTAMIFTWIKNGAPDVSMSLNGSLAGLVAITAGCNNVDIPGAAIIGIVAGILVCVGVYFIENTLKIDDPVGAVAVHFCNGLWGTLAVGLFGVVEDGNTTKGLFYGGGFRQLGIQALAVIVILAWTAVMMTIVFFVIKKTVGLRVSEKEEIEGLDPTEHALESAYPDFQSANYNK